MLVRYFAVSTLLSALFTVPVFAEDYVPNEVLIKWKETPASIDTISTVRVSDVATAVEMFSQDERVEYVEPNYKRYLATVPNDPEYGEQWHLEQANDHDIDVATAWEATTGSSDIIIAVIDTGIDLTHPDLVDNLWANPNEVPDNGIDDDHNGYIDDVHGWDFTTNDNDPSSEPSSQLFVTDYVLHGTHVAGTIGASGNNGVGVTGVNWQVQIMPLKIFNAQGEGDTAGIVEAVAYAIANGADVINMSYGGTSNSQAEANSMEEAADANIVLVAAAGNTATNLNTTPFYPACYAQVIGVGATTDEDVIADFSNFGTDCVDVAAPGDFIYSTYFFDETGEHTSLSDEYGYMSGTSMATPVVSGIAGLVLAANDQLSAAEAREIIIQNADDVHEPTLGTGRVNAGRSVEAAAAPDAVEVNSYHSISSNSAITNQQRTRDASPYFEWEEPSSAASVVGYYVYFGRERLDPMTDGILQTERNYHPTEDLHGNERTYRLRIKTLDSAGHTSTLAQFLYLVDRKVQRPTWNTLTLQADGSVQLRWYKPKGEHVQAYKVYRSTDKEGKYASVSGTITTKKFTDPTVTAGTRYYYKIRAIDDLGNRSALSAIKSIKL